MSTAGPRVNTAVAPARTSGSRRVPTPWIALVCVYFFWGSTYLGIRIAVESFPPFSMAGVRFLLAGALLYPVARRRRGGPPPTREQWLGATSVAGPLLVGGNGLLSYAEQTVPSGIAALLVASVPLWLVLVDRLRGAARLRARTRVGLGLGVVGIALLVRPWTAPEIDRVGALVVLVASLLWALGSIRSRSAPAPTDGPVTTGMQMLVGGAALAVLGAGTGEWARLDLASVSAASVAAVAWLVVPGSIVALTAYNHALKTLPTSTVATYAYVNPVVAVALGWVVLHERHEPLTLVAGAVIAIAVVLIVGDQARRTATIGSPATARGPRHRPARGHGRCSAAPGDGGGRGRGRMIGRAFVRGLREGRGGQPEGAFGDAVRCAGVRSGAEERGGR